MREESSLAELSPGGYGLVAGLAVGGAMGCRLRDLGFLPGASVEALGNSPLGDPIAYLVRGTVIALRRRDAALVRVLPLEGPPHLREGA